MIQTIKRNGRNQGVKEKTRFIMMVDKEQLNYWKQEAKILGSSVAQVIRSVMEATI